MEEEFFNFCATVQLAEVIIGAESKLPTEEITRALGSLAEHVKVKKARPAHNRFQIVEA